MKFKGPLGPALISLCGVTRPSPNSTAPPTGGLFLKYNSRGVPMPLLLSKPRAVIENPCEVKIWVFDPTGAFRSLGFKSQTTAAHDGQAAMIVTKAAQKILATWRVFWVRMVNSSSLNWLRNVSVRYASDPQKVSIKFLRHFPYQRRTLSAGWDTATGN